MLFGSRQDDVFRETFKLVKLIDQYWFDIINRKDPQIPCGAFIVKAKYDAFEGFDYYWRVSVESALQGTRETINFLSVYSKNGSTSDVSNLLMYNSFVMSKDNDTLASDNDNGKRSNDTIPFDRTCGTEERLFSIDIMDADADTREFLRRMVEFQSTDLKNVNIISYQNYRMLDVANQEVYNSLTSRPFFMQKGK